MNQSRVDYFTQLSNEQKKGLTYDDFTVSELTEIINETPLTSLEKELAVERFINRMTYEGLSKKFYYEPRTIKSKLAKISKLLKKTCVKLFFQSEEEQ